MALHRWPAFKPPSQNCNPTFLNPNMANYNQPTNIIPTNGAQYQVTQSLHPINRMRMMNIPRPMITHHVMIVSTLTHYPTPTMINTQAYTTSTNNQPRIPSYHQPPEQTSDLAYQNLPGKQQQQQHQQPSIQQQQQTAQSPNPFISMASPRTIKRALRRKRQRLKLKLSIVNNKTAIQDQEEPVDNNTITDEIASKSVAIEDQTDNQSSMQTQ